VNKAQLGVGWIGDSVCRDHAGNLFVGESHRVGESYQSPSVGRAEEAQHRSTATLLVGGGWEVDWAWSTMESGCFPRCLLNRFHILIDVQSLVPPTPPTTTPPPPHPPSIFPPISLNSNFHSDTP
jgi:hypothetical protein